MADCTDYPTPEDAKRFKNNVGSVDEFITSDSDTFVDQDGRSHLTIEGVKNSYNATFQAQFAYKRIGNISLYVGNSLPEADKLNSYQFPDDSGDWYGPLQNQTFPITIPVDPSVDDGWMLVNAITEISAIARSLNVADTAVIYANDTTTVLDNVSYIYDSSTQTTWGKPVGVGIGETVVSVGGSSLVTNAGSYTLITIDILADITINTDDIAANTANIAVQTSRIDAYDPRIAANTANIAVQTSRIDAYDPRIAALEDGQNSGVVVFQTYALLDTYTPVDVAEEKGSFKVTNDPDSSLNGYYSWVSGTTYTKDASLVANEIDANNTSDGVSGSAVASYTTTSEDYSNSKIHKYDFSFSNYALINTGVTDTSNIFLFTGTDGERKQRYYLNWIDVSRVSEIQVTNSINKVDWKWVFRDVDMNFIEATTDYGDGVFIVPDGAHYASRSIAWENATEDFSTLGIYLKYKNNSEFEIKKEKSYLNNVVEEYLIEKIDYVAVVGALVYALDDENIDTKITITDPNHTTDRAYINWFSVTDYDQIIVENSIANFFWVFRDKDMNVVEVTTQSGNGIYPVPDGAAYAARSLYYESVAEDTVNLSISGRRKNPLFNIVETATGSEIKVNKVLYDYGVAMREPRFVVSPNDFAGNSQTERIKSALDYIEFVGEGKLVLAEDTYLSTREWLITEALTLPSNCWVYLDSSTLKLADSVHDNIIRNRGIVPNSDPYGFAEALNENENIRVYGSGFIDENGIYESTISGPDVPYNDGTNDWVGDAYGWRTINILFANTKSYQVHNLNLIKGRCWSASNENGCFGYKYYDLNIHTDVPQGDGIDNRTGVSHFEIYNISGNTSDDMVACSALQNFVTQHPSGRYLYPMQVGGYDDRGFGVDISHGYIHDIVANSEHQGVRLLASNGSVIENMLVNNITDGDEGTLQLVLVTGTGYGVLGGVDNINNIYVNNIESFNTSKTMNLDGNMRDCWFNNIKNSGVGTGLTYSSAYTYQNVRTTNSD